MDSGFLSGILALLPFPSHTAAFFTATTLLPLKASRLDPPHLSAFGPSAFAALRESLWEALSCPLTELLGFPHFSGPVRSKGQDLFTLSWQDVAVGMEDSPDNRSSVCRVLHTMREDSHKDKHGFSPSSRCQRNGARERARSRSPQWGNDVRSWSVDTTDYDHSAGRRRRTGPPKCDRAPRDDAAPGPSNGSSQSAPTPSAARRQTLPTQRERSRSLRQGYNLRSRFVEITTGDHSGGLPPLSKEEEEEEVESKSSTS